jgi:hypothetical protein
VTTDRYDDVICINAPRYLPYLLALLHPEHQAPKFGQLPHMLKQAISNPVLSTFLIAVMSSLPRLLFLASSFGLEMGAGIALHIPKSN